MSDDNIKNDNNKNKNVNNKNMLSEEEANKLVEKNACIL